MTEYDLNRFDSIAGIYDRLAWIAFGNKIIKSQIHFLNRIPGNAQVLIVGGGTGLIAKELLKLKPNCHITYVDASAKMIAIARQNNISSLTSITFIHGTEESLPEEHYGVVITNFFLDLFPEPNLKSVLEKIKGRLASGGIWLATDFQKPKTFWQRFVLAVMYRFFSVVAKLQNNQLPNWVEAIKAIRFAELETAEFATGFIRSSVFRRINER